MKVIVGLGNPEKKYDGTYHNIGFCFVDKLAQKMEINIKKSGCKSIFGEGKVNNEKIIIAKPQTYMNLSGQAVNELLKKFKCETKDLIVISDDIDLSVGSYRYRESGSAGTHNGLRNIIQVLGKDDFKRIRIGIGRDENMDLADYVLSNISIDNKEKINPTIDKAIEFLLSII